MTTIGTRMTRIERISADSIFKVRYKVTPVEMREKNPQKSALSASSAFQLLLEHTQLELLINNSRY